MPNFLTLSFRHILSFLDYGNCDQSLYQNIPFILSIDLTFIIQQNALHYKGQQAGTPKQSPGQVDCTNQDLKIAEDNINGRDEVHLPPPPPPG